MNQGCGCGGIGLIVLVVVLICGVGLVATCTPGLVTWSPVALASWLAEDAEAAPEASLPAGTGVVEALPGDLPEQEAAASAPAQPAASDSVVVHVVVKGDTLFRLAARFGTTVEAIKAANGLTCTKIVVGQKIVIPVVPKPKVTSLVAVCPTPTPAVVAVPVCPTPAPAVVCLTPAPVVVQVCPPPVVVVPVCPPPVVCVPVCPPVVCVLVCPVVDP